MSIAIVHSSTVIPFRQKANFGRREPDPGRPHCLMLSGIRHEPFLIRSGSGQSGMHVARRQPLHQPTVRGRLGTERDAASVSRHRAYDRILMPPVL